MARNVCLGFLIAMLVTAVLSRPMGDVHMPEAQRKSSRSMSPEPARRDLQSAPSQEQMLFMSKFLRQFYEELSNQDGYLHKNSVHPLKGQDYGWMDFGRRSTEDEALNA